jgi:hypothetical protein
MLRFELVDNHVLLDLGCRVLLDTGAPRSFGRVGSLRVPWLERAIELPARDPLGREVTQVAAAMREVGLPDSPDLDVLLGCDLLAGQRLELDWPRRVLSLGPRPAGLEPRTRAGLPTTVLTISGRAAEAVVDTGARLSYVRRGIVPDAVPRATKRDFNFLRGTREDLDVPLVDCTVTLDGVQLEARIGLATGAVHAALGAAGLDAIVGVDLMRHTRLTTIDCPDEA